jgi:hypothetical protein
MKKKKITAEEFRNKLKLKNFETRNEFVRKYNKANKLLSDKGVDLGKVRQHSAKLLGAGALTSTLLLSPPMKYAELPHAPSTAVLSSESIKHNVSNSDLVISSLSDALPEKTRPLTREEEKQLELLFKNYVGVDARATLEGEHLNTTYGLIGAEQHLRRYPGDTLEQQRPNEGDYGASNPDEILKEGMAPGLGAWGYFAPSKDQLTPDLVETEKWYAVVQTLYLPDWNTRQPYLRDWYKYRKVLIVNTENGKAVVAAIADSGPAAFTGKSFGGSPEVMDYLGGPRYKKGPVIIFFVDDPNNTVPLGPVSYNK